MIEGAYNDLSSDTIVLIDEILELLKSNLSNE